jgi:hypothetical protein
MTLTGKESKPRERNKSFVSVSTWRPCSKLAGSIAEISGVYWSKHKLLASRFLVQGTAREGQVDTLSFTFFFLKFERNATHGAL